MQSFLRFFKTYTLPIAMLLGIIGYRYFRLLAPVTHYLIVLMLYFTFCKVDIKDMRWQPWHGWLLLLQLTLSIGLFYILRPLDTVLAQGIMICILMPTATAAAVVTGKLGGNVAALTTDTFLSNLVVAILVPVFFPIVEPGNHISFLEGFLTILSRVFPLLIGPFLLAWFTRFVYHKLKHRQLVLPKALSAAPFYVWAFSLVILMADTTYSLLNDDYDRHAALWLIIGSLITCLLQFFLGKAIGKHYHMRISAGQALGQKNTILGIWMAHTYLQPVAALGAAGYIVWQNLFNSYQLWKQRKKDRL